MTKATIIVAIDGSEQSKKAFDEAIKLAEVENDVEIKLVTAIDLGTPLMELGPAHTEVETAFAGVKKRDAKKMLEPFEETLQKENIKYETIIDIGAAGDVIVDAAERYHADKLVVGSRGLGALKRLILGSVSTYCVHNAPCSVIVAK